MYLGHRAAAAGATKASSEVTSQTSLESRDTPFVRPSLSPTDRESANDAPAPAPTKTAPTARPHSAIFVGDQYEKW